MVLINLQKSSFSYRQPVKLVLLMAFVADVVIIMEIKLEDVDVVEDVEDLQVVLIQIIIIKVVINFIIFVKVL